MKKQGLILGFAAALLGAAFILAGCEQEEKTSYQSVLIWEDVVAINEAGLIEALADPAYANKVIGFFASGETTLSAALTIDAGYTVVLHSTLTTAASAGLTVKGVLYTAYNGEIKVPSGTADVTIDGGSIGIQKGGKLTIQDVDNVKSGTATALGTGYVTVSGGTLTIDSAGQDDSDKAWASVQSGGLIINTFEDAANTKPSDVVANISSTSADRWLSITVGGEETAAALTIPAGLRLSTSATLGTVTSLTVNGSLTTTGATTLHTTDAAAVTVGAGGKAALSGTIANLANSSVGADAELSATVTNFDTGAKITVGAGATVNGVTFPAATNVTALATAALTIDSLTVDKDTLTIPATKTLTVKGALELKGDGTTKGVLAFTDDDSKVVLLAGASLKADANSELHAKDGTVNGSGVTLTVSTDSADTATGFTSDDVTAPAAVTITTAGAASGTAQPYVIGNASFAVENAATAVAAAAVTSAEADPAGAGEIKAGTGTNITFAGASS
jgi:hypothetical protein